MFLCNLINIEEPLVISKIDKFLREKRDVYEESVVKHASTLETVEW